MYLGDGVAPNRRAPLEIYGPPPLRRYLRDTFRYTGFVTHFPYVVYELWESPDPPQPEPGGDAVDSLEVLGRNIGWKEHELKNGTCSHYWDVVTDDLKARVKAAPIVHTVPCLGYVVQEREHPGTLDVAKVRPYIDENAEALKAERGPLFSPMSLCANLKRGERVRLPDGRVLDPNDCVSKPSKGRKVVILGDTCDPTPIQFIGHSPDILVHESTNAFLASDAPSKSCDTVRQIAISRGHSTPQMAGAFARRLSAKMLVLYHFSPRYKGDESEESTAVMKQVRELAVAEFGRESVVTARDLMVITVARERDGDSRSHIESKSQRGD